VSSSATQSTTIQDAFRKIKFDQVWICTETAAHERDLQELDELGFGGIVLVEKPLFSSDQEITWKSLKKIFITYNLRHHPHVQTLKMELAGTDVIAANLYVGQNLNQWRPAREMRETYSAHESQGGGVSRDLSHEVDLALYLFGEADRKFVMRGNYGALGIQAEEACSILFSTMHCKQAVLQMNYLDHSPRRWLLAHSASASYFIDFIQGTFSRNGVLTPVNVPLAVTYSNQARAAVKGDFSHFCTYEEARAVMRFIQP
jgi:predicted dehydrogenase